MTRDRLDHRVPAYQHREVTLAELRTRTEKAVRRLLWMAWPFTPEATLHRLVVDAFSFSSEDGEKEGETLVTVIADMRNRDLARNAPASNPGGPSFTVTVETRETMTGNGDTDTWTTSTEVIRTRIMVKRDGSDLGERASDIEEAVMRMQLAAESDAKEYAEISRSLDGLSYARRQAEILRHLLRLRGM